MTSVFCLIAIAFTSLFCKSEMRVVFIMTAIGIVTRTMFTYTSYSFQITNRIKYYIFGRYWNLQFLLAFHRHILNMNFIYSGPGKHFLYIMKMRC